MARPAASSPSAATACRPSPDGLLSSSVLDLVSKSVVSSNGYLKPLLLPVWLWQTSLDRRCGWFAGATMKNGFQTSRRYGSVTASPQLAGAPLRQVLPPVELTRGGLGVQVGEIRIEGSTVFNPEELAAVTDRYVGRTLTSEDLGVLRRELTDLYIERGFINSGAFIPDQTVEDGVIILQVVEGRLGRAGSSGSEMVSRRPHPEHASNPKRSDR